jgi:translation initiation factor IF-2
MNNAKVRIYELSKELNLDNRDILAVCEQLNIAVKSHSSTISEEEAEQIRSAAKVYVASKPAKSSPNRSSASLKQPAQAPVKKQQILAIRRNPTLTDPPKRQDAESSDSSDYNTDSPVTSSSPMPSVRPQLKTPPRIGSSTSETFSETLEPEPMTNASAVEVEPISLLESSATEAAQPEVQQPTDPPPPVEAAIAPPPTRPASPPVAPGSENDRPESRSADGNGSGKATNGKAPQGKPENGKSGNRPDGDRTEAKASPNRSQPNRPMIKRPGESTGTDARDGGVPGGSQREGNRDPGNREARAAGGNRPSHTLKPKPTIELRRPPTRPGEATASEAGDTANKPRKVIGTGAAAAAQPGSPEVQELKRPTPPRNAPKRGKWDEEEEQEALKAKAPAKGKRRTPSVVDDEVDIDNIDLALIDEDLDDDEDDSDEDAPVQVTLSLVRPPKPKSNAPKPAATTQKASPQRRRSNDRYSRRDRRQEETRERPEIIALSAGISLHDLAELLVAPETELIKILFMKGIASNINQILDIPTATMVAEELGVLVDKVEAQAEAKKITEMIEAGDLEHLQRRPPIVTVMGHVDHGKTTLLDSIRKTKVAAGEAGGITQHIGAYHVDVEHNGANQKVVFLDTPGHEAFTAMRARGTRVTDVAILVVAADDGVRPQTIEAISHAKAAGVPIVVAINKVDKEEAQPDRVKQELTEFSLVPEEWGGDTIMVPVSAIRGENLDNLLEMILLVTEVEDLHANPDRPAKGTVIEANLDKSKGPVANLIVQNGTLRVGDVLVAGSTFGKVRAMIDDRGNRVKEAGPSFAVQVLGLNDVPAAGDEFDVYRDEKEARGIADSRFDQQRQSRLQQAMASRRVSLGTLSAQAQEGELKELNLVMKADVQGSIEAILGSLQQLPQKEVQVRVLLASPGEVTETDVDLAAASSAVIIGFNTTLATGARQAADRQGVDVREYNIIYKLLEDIQGAMEGLLEPELVEEPLGQVEVRAVFPVGKGAVAGCYILSGKAIRNSKIRVRRKDEVVFEGNLDSLKRMKEDTKEVNAGYECGIGVDNFRFWEEGDIIEVYRFVTKRRTLTV